MYKATFEAIMASSIFRLDGPEIDLSSNLILLANQLIDEEDVNWDTGEYLDCTLGGLINGAYWALTEWHGGQNSMTYAAMCALGCIFNPGYVDGPEPDSDEEIAYDLINDYFRDGGR